MSQAASWTEPAGAEQKWGVEGQVGGERLWGGEWEEGAWALETAACRGEQGGTGEGGIRAR